MAGRRQHYLPRFLQKGFVCRQKKKQYYTFVYEKDRPAYECNLTNIGLETDFYGCPQECSADENITQSETQYSSFIEGLRQIESESELRATECAAFISHMFIRAKSTRKSFQEVGETFYSAFKGKISQFPDQKSLFIHLVETQRNEIEKKIMEKLPPSLNHQKKILLTKYCLDNPNIWLEMLSEKDVTEITKAFDHIIDAIPNTTKVSHNKTLEEATTSKGVSKKLETFSWNLLIQNSFEYILGDTGTICWNDKEKEFQKLLFINDNISTVLLPISKSQLLLGHKGTNHLNNIDFIKINEAIAKLSEDFFICSSKTKEMEILSITLGSKSCLVGDKEKKILEKILQRLNQK